MRLDLFLASKIFIDKSRTQIQRLIRSGKVKINGIIVDKVGYDVKEFEDNVEIIENHSFKYVSRGGYKLEKAINAFNLSFLNKSVMDIGASTGGFTDCSLQHGARSVVAIDVGSNQMAESLRCNNKVTCLENTNFRDLKINDLKEKIFDYVVVDVQFISLKYIFDNIKQFIDENSKIIVLIKPQFEVGKNNIGKKGIVKDKSNHKKAITNVIEFAFSNNIYIESLTFSPIKGGKNGNIEFLALFSLMKCIENNDKINDMIDSVVDDSHSFLKRGDLIYD